MSALAHPPQILLLCLQTESFDFEHRSLHQGRRAEYAFTCIFMAELVVRTISKRSVADLFLSGFWWIDFFSVLPSFVAMTLGGDESWNHLFQSLRVLRLLKIIQHYRDTEVLVKALHLSSRALVVPLVFLLIGVVFFGSAVFYFESWETGQLFSDERANGTAAFPDLGTAIWFMIVTFSTVGYGDTSPTTHAGKAITSIAIWCGAIFLAMPLSIVGGNFALVWEQRQQLAILLRLQAHCLQDEMTMDKLMDLFKTADRTGDGTIDYFEFRDFIQEIGAPDDITTAQLRHVFNVIDEESNDSITFFEFCHFIFPDLDVEELHSQGRMETGVPRDSTGSGANVSDGPAEAAAPTRSDVAPSGQAAGAADSGLREVSTWSKLKLKSAPHQHLQMERNLQAYIDSRLTSFEKQLASNQLALAAKLDALQQAVATMGAEVRTARSGAIERV
jgi:hypothetical protein